MLVIAAKTAVIYVFVVAGIRALGTRELGEMSAYDFVLVVVIANAVQNALVGGDNSLAGGLVSAATLLAMNRAFTALLDRFPALRRRIVGQPIVLVTDGREQPRQMKRQGVDPAELMAALREHGVASLAGEQRLDDILLVLLLSNAVQNAMTTGSGRLSVALVAAGTLLAAGWLTGALFRSRPALERQIGGAPTLLVHRGQVVRAHLEREELSDEDLMAEVRKQGLHDVSDVALAVLEPNGTVSIVPRDQDER